MGGGVPDEVSQLLFYSEQSGIISLGKPSLKKTIFLLTFVNKHFTPPLIIDEKPLRFGGPVRGVTPPLYKSEK